MDVLTIPPTPPDGPVMALPAPVAPPPALPATGLQAGVLHGLRVVGDLLLLPLRVLQRLALDLQTALTHLFLAFWEIVLAVLALGFMLALYAVDSFGENFFIGEVFQTLIPGMRAYVPEATAMGMWLASVFPLLDEVRASTIFAFVVAGGAVLATSIFFHSLKRWQQDRSKSQPAFQEALLLDPQGQETPPALPNPPRLDSLALVGMGVGAGAQLLFLGFEVFAFTQVLGSGLFGVLSALLLLGVRLVFGYVAHFGLGSLILHGRAAGDHVVGFGTSVVAIAPNVIAEIHHRLETLGSA